MHSPRFVDFALLLLLISLEQEVEEEGAMYSAAFLNPSRTHNLSTFRLHVSEKCESSETAPSSRAPSATRTFDLIDFFMDKALHFSKVSVYSSAISR